VTASASKRVDPGNGGLRVISFRSELISERPNSIRSDQLASDWRKVRIGDIVPAVA